MYSMKKYLLLFLCLTLGVAYAQDTLRAVSYTHLDVYKRQRYLMEVHFGTHTSATVKKAS